MNIDDLNCPSCKEQYSQANPPRLLTMCGHTFCHKCIKTLITKKKDKGFKIKCPIDKGSMEMQKPNPSLFPKNIVLIDFLNKNNAEFTSNQFLDVSLVQKNVSTSEKETFSSQRQIQKKNSHEQKTSDYSKKICIQHKKIMDVYCVHDCQIICTDCALFSHHRSHEVKNLTQMLNLESEKIKDLSRLMKGKQEAEEKFMSKEIEDEIFELLDKKKKLIESQITQFFAELRKMIDKKENETKEELEAKGLTTAERMRDKMQAQKQQIEQYRVWEDQVIRIINQLEQNTPEGICKRLSSLIKNGYYENRMKEGRSIIDKISEKQQQFITSFEETLNCFTFSSNLSEVKLALNCKVSCELQQKIRHFICEKSLKHSRTNFHCLFDHLVPFTHDPKINSINSKQFITYDSKILPTKVHPEWQKEKQNYQCQHDDQEESLLDLDTNFDSKPLKPSTFSCNNISILSVNSTITDAKGKKHMTLKPKKGQELSRRSNISQISSKSRTLTGSGSKSSLKSVNRLQKQQTTKVKKNKQRFKYQSLIESISGNKIDTVDLTGAQPKSDELMMILDAVQSSQSVKTVKLMRNKLDDSFIEKGLRCLLSVERLNLAQNKFSQQAVDAALSILKEHPEHKMQSLNMGQNRIVERKNRKVLDEFKKVNVNIVF